MDTFLYGTMIFLMLLAAFNLFVGVSNDAVNFLGSALGSKAAPYNRVMLVAALGVLLGCTFSSGMMEIARSGIFNPTKFTYADIMTIFFAVMITDTLLLDTFNSLGLPTSTTVSIVFELLGGSVMTAAYRLYKTTDSLAGIGAYINNEKALAIITGILMSVVIAFTCGLIIQWIVRLIFSFKYKNVYRYLGGVYAGFCLTAILYFLVIKGAKGSSFMTPEMITWINTYTYEILICSFVILSVFFQLLISFFNFNALRTVILAGTFALAFAFAGNDLVNFVGVPFAALQSTEMADAAFEANQALTPATFMMTGLAKSVQTPTLYLILSGLIMVATLWWSPKAQRVVQTSINLSASDRSDKEQFGSSLPSRLMVRSVLSMNKIFNQIMPKSILRGIDSRWTRPPLKKGEIPLPFDQVRASVNLVVASILIALATSLKLPLSTTYVTFMVAMGSSLADGAWDRESAVYRISGVLAVISGWFLTAFTAFTACAIVAWLCLIFGKVFMIIAGLFLLFILIKTNIVGRKKESRALKALTQHLTKEQLKENLNQSIGDALQKTVDIFINATRALLNEDLGTLSEDKDKAQQLLDDIAEERSHYYLMIVQGAGSEADYDVRNYYYRTFSNIKDVCHLLRNVVNQEEQHIANSHSVFKGELKDNLLNALDRLQSLQTTLDQCIRTGCTSEEGVLKLSDENLAELNSYQTDLMKQVDLHAMPLHRSELYWALLQFCLEVINRYIGIVLLQKELNYMLSKQAEKEEKPSGPEVVQLSDTPAQ
ncbi:MAG: inorganic phosphate transporter [Burkholderiales bacterium]|nr:inorganic phosphate transporter [Burkholderiales bacterium]